MRLRSALDRIRNRGLVRPWTIRGSIAWVVGLVLIGIVMSLPGAAQVPRTKAPEAAHLYFISPKDHESVSSPFVVRFGLDGMGVAPAGVDKPNTGHHHLIIDSPLPDMSLPIPNDDKHRHFGGGQTQVTLDLPPGDHTLQLLLGDKNHVPFDPPVVSDRITVVVR